MFQFVINTATNPQMIIAALVGAACSDTGTGISADQAQVQAAYEQQTGFTDSDFGDLGAVVRMQEFAQKHGCQHAESDYPRIRWQ